jgi:SOS-response transcriptional repressor LexA
MSVRAIDWALRVNAGRTGPKCVLLTLASYADEKGICWPSQSTIARQTEQSVDSVQRHLKTLEERGLLVRRRRQNGPGSRGGRQSDVFVLAMKDEPQSAVLPQAVDRSVSLHCKRTVVKPQRARPYKEEPSRTVINKPPHQNGTVRHQARGKSWRSKDGATEVEIAGRIGPQGLEVLSAIPSDEAEQLCARQRYGRLDDAAIEELAERGRRMGILQDQKANVQLPRGKITSPSFDKAIENFKSLRPTEALAHGTLEPRDQGLRGGGRDDSNHPTGRGKRRMNRKL